MVIYEKSAATQKLKFYVLYSTILGNKKIRISSYST